MASLVESLVGASAVALAFQPTLLYTVILLLASIEFLLLSYFALR